VVCLSVCLCLLVTLVSPAKTAQPTEMPLWAYLGGPIKPCIIWGLDAPRGRGNFGVVRPIEKH